jgi:aryl-alcohol dehydrogenase-like predicted oxidoreductase
MKKRQLGRGGPLVGEVGFGCMSFGGIYGATDKAESFAALAKAMELGVDHLDTAQIYGPDGLSETIIGEFLKQNPSNVTIATKAGIVLKPERHYNNKADYLRQSLEGSLRRLGVDHVALYYLHRRDQEVPIEDAIGTLVRFKEEGKIGGIGLSEVAPATLERASAVHPIMAVQNEYSLWSRQPDLGLVDACARSGTAFVAFSPVGRGVFADTAPDPSTFPPGDFRRSNPRFEPGNYEANDERLSAFRTFAMSRGWTTSALAIAWTLHRGDHVIPIPGTRSVAHLEQNARASEINLSQADLAEIDRILPAGFAHGDRYSDAQATGVERYC